MRRFKLGDRVRLVRYECPIQGHSGLWPGDVTGQLATIVGEQGQSFVYIDLDAPFIGKRGAGYSHHKQMGMYEGCLEYAFKDDDIIYRMSSQTGSSEVACTSKDYKRLPLHELAHNLKGNGPVPKASDVEGTKSLIQWGNVTFREIGVGADVLQAQV